MSVRWVLHNIGLRGEFVGKKLPSYMAEAFCEVSRIARQVVGEKLPSYRFIGPIANSLRLIRSHKEIGWFPLQGGLCGEAVGKKLPSYRVHGVLLRFANSHAGCREEASLLQGGYRTTPV